MSAASQWLKQNVLNQWFRGQAVTPPATLYVSLHTADPTDAGTGTEVTGGSYARVAITSNTSNWEVPAAAGTNYRVTNKSTVTFPSPSADWGVITHFALWSASSSGNLVVFGPLTVARTILNGDNPPSFAIGSLAIDLG